MSRILSYLLLTLTIACQSGERNSNTPKKKLDHEARFTEFSIDDYAAVVIKCDLGRLNLNVRQYAVPKLEIHKTYQKYVRLEPSNDTLYIFTENTPRSTDQVKIHKYINLYLPNMSYLETDVSQITIQNYETERMSIVNRGNGLRLFNCKIKDLDLQIAENSNVQLDGNNYFDDLYVKLDENSHYNGHGMVLKKFVLETKSLKNTNFSNLPPDGFQWIKD